MPVTSTTPETEQRIASLYREGKTYDQIRAALSADGIKPPGNMVIVRCVRKFIGEPNRLPPLPMRSLAISLAEEGVPYKEIAKQCGYKWPQTVSGMVRRAGVRSRRSQIDSPKFREQVVTMYSTGMSDGDIAKALDVNHNRVYMMRHKILKLPPNTNKVRVLCQQNHERIKEKHGSLSATRWKKQRYDAWLDGAPQGMTLRRWEILKTIRNLGQTDAKTVSEATGRGYYATVVAIKHLIKSGYVRIVKRQYHKNRLIEAV